MSDLGQRVSDAPITANVLAADRREGEGSWDAAMMVSCDLVAIPRRL